MELDLTEIYYKVNPKIDNDFIENRISGIQKYLDESISDIAIINLIHLYFQMDIIDEDCYSIFIDSFREYDQAFSRRKKEEISLLAGYALTKLINVKEVTFKIILPFITASFLIKETPHPEISSFILQTFKDSARKNRSMPLKDQQNISIDFSDIRKYISEVSAEETAVEGEEPIDYEWGDDNWQSINMKLVDKIENLFSSLNNEIINKEEKQLIYYEDSQILWWLTGEYSRDHEKHFSKLTKESIPITIGKELSDLVSIMPGPYAAQSVLHRLLKSIIEAPDEVLSLYDAVNGLDKDWKHELTKDFSPSQFGNITPIFHAIYSSLQVSNGANWKEVFNNHSIRKIDKIKYSYLDFSNQFYLECLSRRAMAE